MTIELNSFLPLIWPFVPRYLILCFFASSRTLAMYDCVRNIPSHFRIEQLCPFQSIPTFSRILLSQLIITAVHSRSQTVRTLWFPGAVLIQRVPHTAGCVVFCNAALILLWL
jgi:hypothetical protein